MPTVFKYSYGFGTSSSDIVSQGSTLDLKIGQAYRLLINTGAI